MTLLMNVTNIFSVVLVAQVGPLSVSELLTKAEHYNRQPVTVIGTIRDVRAHRWRRQGPTYTFDLSDGSEIVHVVAFSEPSCQSGTATVEGIFEDVKWGMSGSYSRKEITAHNVICLPDAMDPRGPKGKCRAASILRSQFPPDSALLVLVAAAGCSSVSICLEQEKVVSASEHARPSKG